MEKRKLAFILGILGGIFAMLLTVLTLSGVTTGEIGATPPLPFSSPSVFMPILIATLGITGAAMSKNNLKTGSYFMLVSAVGGPIILGWSYFIASAFLAASGLMGLLGNMPAISVVSPAAPVKTQVIQTTQKPKSMKTQLLIGGAILFFIIFFFIFQGKGTNPILPKAHSMYEGTYNGTFNYQCQRNTFDGQGNLIEGDWVPNSFDFTIQLTGDGWADTYGDESLGIVSVQVSDPVFGATTSASAVGQMNMVSFKQNPKGNTAEFLSGYGNGFIINLPGGMIEMPAYPGTNMECHFMIAADGSEMHSIPCDSAELWLASTRSGCFTADNYGFTPTTDIYYVKYGDWSLKKVA